MQSLHTFRLPPEPNLTVVEEVSHKLVSVCGSVGHRVTVAVVTKEQLTVLDAAHDADMVISCEDCYQ